MKAGRVVMVPLNQRFRERVFDVLLQGPAQRTRSVGAICHRLTEDPLLGFVGNRDGNRFLGEVRVELRDHKLQNLDQVGLAQSLEQNDLVQAVEEFGIESSLYFALHQLLDLAGHHVVGGRLEAEALALLQVTRADVGSHDQNGVFEIDRVAETVSQLAVFENLQQNVEHVRVRLLDFVEQNDRIWRALDAFRQLTTLFVANVSRRRSDQLRDRVLFHELGHVEPNQGFLGAKHELSQGTGDFCLADAGWAEE